MELIRLNRSHKNDFKKINDITEKELENPEFFIGFFTEDEIDNILENSKKDDKTIFYGYFNEKELFSIICRAVWNVSGHFRGFWCAWFGKTSRCQNAAAVSYGGGISFLSYLGIRLSRLLMAKQPQPLA